MTYPTLNKAAGIVLLSACIPMLAWTTKSGAAGSAKTREKNQSTYTSNLEITSKLCARDFKLDGDIRKSIWKRANWVRFDHDLSGHPHYPQSETRVASVWTPNSVYFAYRCKYTTLNLFKDGDPTVDTDGLWNRDVAEMFISAIPEHMNHYYEFEVSPNNLGADLEIDRDNPPPSDIAWNSHFEHATHIDAKRHIWTCEIRIPAAPMGVKRISAGSEWRLNLFRADGPGDNTQRRLLAWSPIPGERTFHNPTRFGIIKFVK